MRVRTQRIRQGLVSVLAILSMCASSVAACACSHHGQAQEDETKSCHAPASPSALHHSEQTSVESGTSFRETCFCVRPSVDTSVKAEAFKFKKAPLGSSANPDLEPELFSSVVGGQILETSLVIRSKLFAGSKSTRGPPSL